MVTDPLDCFQKSEQTRKTRQVNWICEITNLHVACLKNYESK